MLIATHMSLPQEAVSVPSLLTSLLCTLLVIFKIAYLQTLHIMLENVGFFHFCCKYCHNVTSFLKIIVMNLKFGHLKHIPSNVCYSHSARGILH